MDDGDCFVFQIYNAAIVQIGRRYGRYSQLRGILSGIRNPARGFRTLHVGGLVFGCASRVECEFLYQFRAQSRDFHASGRVLIMERGVYRLPRYETSGRYADVHLQRAQVDAAAAEIFLRLVVDS